MYTHIYIYNVYVHRYRAIYTYIYIYIYTNPWRFRPGTTRHGSAFALEPHSIVTDTCGPYDSSHHFNLHNFKLMVSNPRTIAYVHFNMPFEHSNLPGAGPISLD